MIGTLELETESPSITGADITAHTFHVLKDVGKERQRQDTLWGEQSHDPITWIAILTEEVGEASKEALTLQLLGDTNAKMKLYTELLHSAAVATAAAESLIYGAAGLGR
jgi:hypothetical protein